MNKEKKKKENIFNNISSELPDNELSKAFLKTILEKSVDTSDMVYKLAFKKPYRVNLNVCGEIGSQNYEPTGYSYKYGKELEDPDASITFDKIDYIRQILRKEKIESEMGRTNLFKDFFFRKEPFMHTKTNTGEKNAQVLISKIPFFKHIVANFGTSRQVRPIREGPKFGVSSETVLDLLQNGHCDRSTLKKVEYLQSTTEWIELAQVAYPVVFTLLDGLSAKLKNGAKVHKRTYHKYDEKGRAIEDVRGDPITYAAYTAELKDKSIYDDILKIKKIREIIGPCNESTSQNLNRHATGAIRCLIEGLDRKIKTLDRIVKSDGKSFEHSPSLHIKRRDEAFGRGLGCLRSAMDTYDEHLVRRDLIEDIKEYF